jgi:GNAT superfamily N-acetyltransferase
LIFASQPLLPPTRQEEFDSLATFEAVVMTTPIEIRSIQKSDYTAWMPLWEGYNAFYGRLGATALPQEVTAMTWSRFFDAFEPVHALVAYKGNELVGLAHYLYHRSTIAINPNCYLQDLFTSATSRGQGAGRALINAVYERAQAAGCPRVLWTTHETNTVAMKLYDRVAEKTGFQLYVKGF